MSNRSLKRPSWKRLRNSRKLIKQLEREGWYLSDIKGDHHQFKHPNQPGKATVSHPQKDIPIHILRNIYRQTGWDWA